MLAAAGSSASRRRSAIQDGLDPIEAEIAAGTFPFRDEFEDIHMNVEARLGELIGPAAGRLHTARSRNDQVALDFRLWVREPATERGGASRRPAAALLGQGRARTPPP